MQALCFTPDWPLPAGINAAMTTRAGGVSLPPFDSFNLGLHVGDVAGHVQRNRALLAEALALPQAPLWLEQVHGTDVYDGNRAGEHDVPCADAAWTDQPGRVLAIMTADCLPVLFASRCGQVVAVAHAGWRGLASGVLANTIAALPVPAAELRAWLGPAIGPANFEVGAEVLQAFANQDAELGGYFQPLQSAPGKFHADLYGLARAALRKAGVQECYGGEYCTVADNQQFFSHRRDAGLTGRMAALIWRR